MFSLFRYKADRLFIDRGRVRCPLRTHDVEADACLGCRRLLQMEEDGPAPFVRCKPVTVVKPQVW